MPDWRPYSGKKISDAARGRWLRDAPPWRSPPAGQPPAHARQAPPLDPASRGRAERYVLYGDETLDRINIALLLRRPLLVRGDPGVGKSSLAYRLALDLGLGQVLRWEINSRTALRDGLYHYDAVSHLQATQADKGARVAQFVRLGPLGTALLPGPTPRVLLIDELDKGNYDLPNDLLHVLEEGAFEIGELARVPEEGSTFDVRPAEVSDPPTVTVPEGRVRVHHHPVVVITTNNEREFPEAFMRRVVSLEMKRPQDEATFGRIVKAQWGPSGAPAFEGILQAYDEESTDVLLQALRLESAGVPREVAGKAVRRRQ